MPELPASHRHPALHPAPEVLAMPERPGCIGRSIAIEIGRHTDGRWMWGVRWWAGDRGSGFACAPKWGRFAATRSAAIAAAVAEASASMAGCGPAASPLREWLRSLDPAQGDLFADLPA